MLKKRAFACASVCIAILFFTGCLGSMKADMQLHNKQYDEAITLYQEYLAENPGDSRARSRLGFAYLKTGKLDQAITQLETVIKEQPGDPYAILYLGMAYLNKERLGDAIKTWLTYRNKKEPIVEEEIKRLLTIVQIAESQRAASKALAEEKKLNARKTEPNSVAVCYYQDMSPDKSLRAFQKGLAAMVITDLSKIQSLKVVDRIKMQALLAEMKLGQTGIVNPGTAPRIGRLLGAENLIVGNLSLGSIKALTSLASTTSKKVKGTASEQVEQENFFDLPKMIIQDTAKILGITLSSREMRDIGIPHTRVYQAFIHYGEALDALDAGKWQKAKDLFNKALQLDPEFDLVREGRDSCPGASAPSIKGLKTMTISQIAAQVESSIEDAKEKQNEADKESEESKGAGGGGGGGGGGSS